MKSVAVCLSVLLAGASLPAIAAVPPAKALEGTVARTGLLPVHVDVKEGRILLSLPAPDAEGVSGRFLYVTSLKTGLGSAVVGLDRAMTSGSKILVFRRMGKKIAAEIENPRFRAAGAPEAERAAARDSFATSTVWMGDVAAETADGRLLVDVAGFLTRDAIGIGEALKRGDAKEFKLVPELSAADPNAVKVFPDNIELEARQTYAAPTPAPRSTISRRRAAM